MINFGASKKYLLMKAFGYPVVIVLAVLTCGGCSDKNRGLIRSEKGMFEIRFPGEYKDTLITMDDATYGTLAKRVVSSERQQSATDSMQYIFIYCEYPSSQISSHMGKDIVDSFFTQTIRTSIFWKRDSLILDEPIEMNGYPGRKIRTNPVNGNVYGMSVLMANIFLVNNRLYQLVVFCQKEHGPGNSADQFFRSFRLLKSGS
jgi:hypothetical protein